MNERDFIKLLRLYQHDLMNHLQIIHGYLSMGYQDKVNVKVNDLLSCFEKERTLMETNAPNFIIWLLQVNHLENNIRVNYCFEQTYGKINLISIDDQVTLHCKQFIECIKLIGSVSELYEITIKFSVDRDNSSVIHMNFQISEQLDKQTFLAHLPTFQTERLVHLEQTVDGLNCNMTYFT